MKTDYIVVTDANEWIASYFQSTVEEVKEEIASLDLSHWDGDTAFCYAVNSVSKAEIELDLR